MSNYIDGFVLPVPKRNLEAYRKMATDVGKVWMEHGALAYMEYVAEDVQPGKLTSYPQAVMLAADETVVIAWIAYESRAHRDKVNAAVTADPRTQEIMTQAMPFDGKRMFWGGFEKLVEL